MDESTGRNAADGILVALIDSSQSTACTSGPPTIATSTFTVHLEGPVVSAGIGPWQDATGAFERDGTLTFLGLNPGVDDATFTFDCTIPDPDPDTDGDGIPDDDDDSPTVPNAGQADQDGDNIGDACDSDRDGDGIPNGGNDCADVPNPGQADQDGDNIGDACDSDLDGDGVPNGGDNCPTTPNADQHDADNDGLGDECDPFPGSSAGCKATAGGNITTAGGDRATFGGNAQAKSATAVAGQLEYTDHGPASPFKFKSQTVDSVICSGTQATIRGTGSAAGFTGVPYRIDVRDNGEPGRSDTYRIRIANAYDSGERTLDGGNVQVKFG